MTHADASSPQPAWGALRHRGFALFWVSRFCTTFATQIVSVAVGWQIYDLTRDPFDLGLVGLVQFAPSLLLVLVTGAVSDRFNRRMIVAICQFIEAICAGLLLYLVWTGDVTVPAIFATLVAFGVARAFMNPASQSLIPNLVPAEALASAIALSSSSWQIAVILGPVAGGLLYGLGADIAYFAAVAIFIAAAILIALVPRPPQKTVPEPANWTTVIAGFRYVWHEKIVLGAIVVALVLAVRPIRDHAGLIMFACVALFGAFTLTFGLSTLVWLSVAALALAGAADMVSVYIRETLIQLWTPDAVRGRVNAVNMVFIGASNELGEFRAGSVAALIGLVPAVVIGGIGTIAVAGLWMFMFPALRKARHLSGRV